MQESHNLLPMKGGDGNYPFFMSDTTNLQELKKQKLDPMLYDITNQELASVPVIVQTTDGLKDSDRRGVEKLGGKVKDDLYIINAFSADLSSEAILEMIKSPRVKRIFFDSEVRAV